MNATKILGIISLTLLLIGGLFKTMHWPGSGINILLGFLIFKIFALTALVSTSKELQPKWFSFIEFSVFILLSIGLTFKVMFWPGGGFFTSIGSFLAIFAYLPALFFFRFKEGSISLLPQQLVGFAMVLILVFTKTLNPNSVNSLNADLHSVETLKDVKSFANQMKHEFRNANLSQEGLAVMESANSARETIRNTWGYILEQTEGIDRSIADTLSLKYCSQKDNYELPSNILIGDPVQPKSGPNSANQIKMAVQELNDQVSIYFNGNPPNGLLIDLTPKLEMGTILSWEVRSFYHSPLTTVVERFHLIELQILQIENAILIENSIQTE